MAHLFCLLSSGHRRYRRDTISIPAAQEAVDDTRNHATSPSSDGLCFLFTKCKSLAFGTVISKGAQILGVTTVVQNWPHAELLIVRGNIPLAEVDEIAKTFSGKEIWTIGSGYAHEDWSAAMEKFPICHLGNVIFTTAIQQLISSPPAASAITAIHPTSPVFELFPHLSLTKPTLTAPRSSLQVDIKASARTLPVGPYIMVVDDNLIVSPLRRVVCVDPDICTVEPENPRAICQISGTYPGMRRVIHVMKPIISDSGSSSYASRGRKSGDELVLEGMRRGRPLF